MGLVGREHLEQPPCPRPHPLTPSPPPAGPTGRARFEVQIKITTNGVAINTSASVGKKEGGRRRGRRGRGESRSSGKTLREEENWKHRKREIKLKVVRETDWVGEGQCRRLIQKEEPLGIMGEEVGAWRSLITKVNEWQCGDNRASLRDEEENHSGTQLSLHNAPRSISPSLSGR